MATAWLLYQEGRVYVLDIDACILWFFEDSNSLKFVEAGLQIEELVAVVQWDPAFSLRWEAIRSVHDSFYWTSASVIPGELFRKYDPVVVPQVARSTERETPVWLERLRLPVLAPMGVMLFIVSLLVIIDRGGATQRFIYMIF